MKAMQLKRMLTLLALVASPALALAAGPTLKLGDAAPKLQTGKWIQGDPVKTFDKDKAYIVEFWATWCGPCRVSIPHLNEIYQKYKDKGLVVIGQDCFEHDDNLVAPFVEKMGDKMTYRVALDDKSQSDKGEMAMTWMDAAGRNGIPSAFLVDKKGLIAWIGHPLELDEKVLEAVLEGTFDIQKAAKNEAELRKYWVAINKAMAQKQWDEAQDQLEQAEKFMSENQRENMKMLHMNILFNKEQYPAAYKLATEISDAHKDNSMLQNDLAWRIATSPDIKDRDLKVAELCANRANEASNGKDAPILDTLARVKFMQGQKEEAVALQEKAVALSDGPQKEQLQRTLDAYKRGELTKAD